MEISEEGKPCSGGIEESAGYLLWQSAMHWQRSVNHVLAAFNLTYTQFIVLMITGRLKKQQVETYQHQVARSARIDRMMTSRVIANLERKGFIKRIKNTRDARANLVQLTPSGITIMEKASHEVEKLEKRFFSDTGKGETG